MRINKIEQKSADVTLSSDELVKLNNVLYFYEQHHAEFEDSSELDEKSNEIWAQIIIAMNISQYGHLDDFALKCVNKRRPGACKGCDE